MHSLIIIDWDDTLFPTSWVMKNNINLQDGDTREKYKALFLHLDGIVARLLINKLNYGPVIIVTNASIMWIKLTLSLMPQTIKLLQRDLKVLSARDLYQEQYPKNVGMWKKMTFIEIAKKNPFKNLTYKPTSIVSIGDAEYEHEALINLHGIDEVKDTLLKSVKLVPTPTYKKLVDQLMVLNKATPKIVKQPSHLDLNFRHL